MSDSVSVPADLPAAEALRLADRARAAARQPVPLPNWYGPAFAAGFTAYGTVVGYAIDTQRIWLVGVFSGAWSLLSGLAARAAMRGSGIMPKGMAPGTGGAVVLAVLAVTLVGLAAAALTWVAAGGPQWICTVAGLAAGVAFWVSNQGVNRRIRRLREAG
ncbi:hypothetical protein AB0C76_25525 [Kitasatospora sp. NPDC048722]|uniref:hypothetical protein n=1 Tax=Kitasatospora sp. NPDC048722 TaxID=3155639 RepID=UPI0033CD0D5D